MWVILLRDITELLVVFSTVAREHRVEAGSITHVVESVVKTSLLGGIVNFVSGILNPDSNNVIVGRANPLNYLRVAEVYLRRVQA